MLFETWINKEGKYISQIIKFPQNIDFTKRPLFIINLPSVF